MDIPNFPNYKIYLDGRVYSKKRKIFMKTAICKAGYVMVPLYKNNKILYKSKNFRYNINT